MSLLRSCIAADLSINRRDQLAAASNERAALGALRSPSQLLYQDTEHRRSLRLLLNGAGLAGANAKLAFVKADGTLRYMLCSPVPEADTTARFVTVKDLELTESREAPAFRRVNLDTVVKLELVYSPAGVM